MKLNQFFCFSLITLSQLSYSAGITNTESTNTQNNNTTKTVKVSVIGKALNAQKLKGEQPPNNQLKVLRSINSTPTQKFFSAQNQKVTRLIQSVFS